MKRQLDDAPTTKRQLDELRYSAIQTHQDSKDFPVLHHACISVKSVLRCVSVIYLTHDQLIVWLLMDFQRMGVRVCVCVCCFAPYARRMTPCPHPRMLAKLSFQNNLLPETNTLPLKMGEVSPKKTDHTTFPTIFQG